jgi:DNA (cytosine-5)-methyltransferase 1
MKYKEYYLKDVLAGEKKSLFTVVSTFAGGGGSSTGYRLAGGKILAINEFVEEARKTYNANYPTTLIIPDDIKKLTGKSILKQVKLKEKELDILDGSPPCSAFSVAGSLSHGEGNTHKDGFGKTKQYSDIDEVTNVEDLFFEFLRIAKDIKPKIIIGENVKGLTIGEAVNYYHKILNTFESIGYYVTSKVLSSKNFGVPQSRERTFFIAVREDVADKLGISFLNMSSLFPKENDEIVTLGEAIDGIDNDKEEVQMLLDSLGPEKAAGLTLSKMPKNPNKILTGMDYHPKKHHFNLKRTSSKLPCPTITAMGNFASFPGVCHYGEDRKFTIKELKRIMSLPEDYILTGKHNKQSERIGRMVPPYMMRAIAESVYSKVLKPYKELND